MMIVFRISTAVTIGFTTIPATLFLVSVMKILGLGFLRLKHFVAVKGFIVTYVHRIPLGKAPFLVG
jgi:hypothetical protein